ncbi:MAG: hypothetical protein K6F41_07480 [Lachnospira sp.]|nr:hypothetical protein [Lachnospira sp.]
MKKCKRIEIILFLLLVIQMLSIAIFNIFRLPYVAGFDSSAAMAQAMEIWKEHTIFLKDWSYQATLGLDSVLMLASLFYGLIGNIFIAYGLADCVIIFLYFYIIYGILKEINISKSVRLFIMIVMFTPYSLEPLGYMPMLFTNASYYSVKVLIPFMLIFVLIKLYKKKEIGEYIVILSLLVIMMFFTAFSCGIYVMICGIFPILAYELYAVVTSGKLSNIVTKRLIVYGLIIVAFVLGYISTVIYGQFDFTNGMKLCSVYNFTDNFSNFFVGWLQLFGALYGRELNVTSPEGIYCLVHCAVVIILLALILRYLKKYRPLKKIYEAKHESLRMHVVGICEFIIIINALILLLTYTKYGSDTFEFRYLLFSTIAAFIIFGAALDDYLEGLKQGKRELLFKTSWGILILVWTLANFGMYPYYQGEDYYENARQISEALEDIEELDAVNDVDLWYFIGDGDICEIARVMRLYEKEVDIVDALDLYTVRGWGTKASFDSAIDAESSHLLVVSDSDETNIESLVNNGYIYLETVGDYQIYLKEIIY